MRSGKASVTGPIRRLGAPLFGLLAFAIALAALAAFFLRQPLIYDSDSYFHLAIARAYAEQGILDELPWARFSLMADGFGDKELLFHVFLAPFASIADPVLGGRIALAILLAALFATIALLGRSYLGSWSLLLPFWLAFASTEVAWRWVRLRPEIVSLLLLLWALWAIAHRRYRLLAVLALLYALSYTAFHAFAGLCVLLFVFELWARRRFEPQLLLFPALGIGLGLIVHPHFPTNLEVWVVQSLEFFRQKAELDVGTEIRPNYTDVLLLVNLGWFLGMATLWRSSEPRTVPPNEQRAQIAARLGDSFGVATVAFGGLYLLMSRFSQYALPLATLWLLFELERRGMVLGPRTRLPGSNRSLPLAAAAAICVLVALPEAARQWNNYTLRTSAGPQRDRIVDRERLSALLPEGAKVAATWQQTPVYMLWAPQARYLNVLDPVFLAVNDPTRHRVQSRVFGGREPDVPLAVATALDSRYLAVSAFVDHDRMRERLAHDPRVAMRHNGLNRLWEVLPDQNSSFLLSWRSAPGPSTDAPSAAGELASWRSYPRLPAIGARVEAFVDLRRFGDGSQCRLVAHALPDAVGETWWLELASAGPASVWWNGQAILDTAGHDALIGAGATFPVQRSTGDVISVRSCPPADAEEPFGFFLSRVESPTAAAAMEAPDV
jgi:hypothetical protein